MEEALGKEQVLWEERQALPAGSDPARPLSALCISGGGIRSATFGLGVIQSLADQGLLEQFDYLSTVSGGGYIGSWLTAWATRGGGIENVVPRLKKNAPPPAPGEPDPIQHLREYNNYLTPQLGGFSEDTWTLIATVVRNILLNWLVLVPLLLGFLMAPRFMLALARLAHFYESRPGPASYYVALTLSLFCDVLFVTALVNIWRYLPGVGGRNHTRLEYFKYVLAPLVGSALLYCAYDAQILEHNLILWHLLLWNLALALFTWVVYLVFCSDQPWRARGRLFRKLLLAVVLLGLFLGATEWAVSNRVVNQHTSWKHYVTYVPPLLNLSFCAALGLFAGLSGPKLEDRDREWMSKCTAGLLMFCAAWMGACLVVLVAPAWVLEWNLWAKGSITAIGAAAGWVASQGGNPGEGASAAMKKAAALAMRLAPPLFIIALAIGLTIATNGLLFGLQNTLAIRHHRADAPWFSHDLQLGSHRTLLENSGLLDVSLTTLAFLGVAVFMARYININRFSLNAMYRDRLVRAYLGASNPDRVKPVARGAKVGEGLDLFTGFAESDDLRMHNLTRKPFHVVNLTLNVVSSKRLAWQQRKARPFSVTPLYCGNYQLGYRATERYAGGITLGMAVSVSGAAASPSMGYHTSTTTGFIMTLLNARLGAWLGNPGPAGDGTWRRRGPKSAIRALLSEALGLTTDESRYVYLSDGGHFENLGLYEMVLRRCRTIVLIDSGCDAGFTFEDLGNALRKIRIDFGIPIVFEGDSFEAVRAKKKRCAVARIDYAEADGAGEPGRLVYIKPMMTGDEPPDVTTYAARRPNFPHESTGDQWFNESQTESYRMLGKITLNEICGELKAAGRWNQDGKLAEFPEYVKREYLGMRMVGLG
jgi:hypothetical protein